MSYLDVFRTIYSISRRDANGAMQSTAQIEAEGPSERSGGDAMMSPVSHQWALGLARLHGSWRCQVGERRSQQLTFVDDYHRMLFWAGCRLP